jgi:hypothetical protein
VLIHKDKFTPQKSEFVQQQKILEDIYLFSPHILFPDIFCLERSSSYETISQNGMGAKRIFQKLGGCEKAERYRKISVR